MSEITVLSAGLYTTIQDLGRLGYAAYGVPLSGSLDQRSAQLANALVGNANTAAVMEITLLGPKLKFAHNIEIAIVGAPIQPQLNGTTIPMSKMIKVTERDILSFGSMPYGCRSYLAVSGGFDVSVILGSRSFYKPVTPFNVLRKGQTLSCGTQTSLSEEKVVDDLPHSHFNNREILVKAGPEFEMLSASAQVFQSEFTVASQSSRMAYVFKETIQHNLPSIATSPAAPGTVQLTPSGQLIVLMRDAQVTGGYPRVLQLPEESIDQMAQKRPGDKIRFQLQ